MFESEAVDTTEDQQEDTDSPSSYEDITTFEESAPFEEEDVICLIHLANFL